MDIEALSSRAKELIVSEPVTDVVTNEASQAPAIMYKTPDWNIKDILNQARLFSELTITGSTGTLWSQTVSLQNIANWLDRVNWGGFPMLNLFRFYRCQPEFILEVSSNFQQVGAFALAFVPHIREYLAILAGLTNVIAVKLTYNEILQIPHQIVTLGHSGTYRVKTDWIFPESFDSVGAPHLRNSTAAEFDNYFSRDGINWYNAVDRHFGFIQAEMIAPLRVVTGSVAAVTIKVWLKMNWDVDVYYPIETLVGSGWVPTNQPTRSVWY